MRAHLHEFNIAKKSAVTATLAKATRQPGGKPSQAPLAVRASGVHGRGVYATAPLAAGDRLIEYVGEIISWDEALRRHPHDPEQPNHTFYFHIDDGRVIDALHGGNDSRWINHSCEPNCEAEEKKGRVFIKALRDIAAGEELFYDYGLVLEGRHTAKIKAEYACHCGHAECRGTMLAPKRAGLKTPKASSKKATKGASADAKGKATAKAKLKPESTRQAKPKSKTKIKIKTQAD